MTIPVPFTTEPETRSGFPCSAFRWTFQVEPDFIGVVHQHCSDGRWLDSHTAIYCAWWRGSNWTLFGFRHLYFDGPHCTLQAGPVVFQWHNPTCRKCMGDEA